MYLNKYSPDTIIRIKDIQLSLKLQFKIQDINKIKEEKRDKIYT